MVIQYLKITKWVSHLVLLAGKFSMRQRFFFFLILLNLSHRNPCDPHQETQSWQKSNVYVICKISVQTYLENKRKSGVWRNQGLAGSGRSDFMNRIPPGHFEFITTLRRNVSLVNTMRGRESPGGRNQARKTPAGNMLNKRLAPRSVCRY